MPNNYTPSTFSKSDNMYPHLLAAVNGHETMMQWMIELPNYPLTKKIKTLQLIGAHFTKECMYDLTVMFWREAAQLEASHAPDSSFESLISLQSMLYRTYSPEEMDVKAIQIMEQYVGVCRNYAFDHILTRQFYYAKQENFEMSIALALRMHNHFLCYNNYYSNLKHQAVLGNLYVFYYFYVYRVKHPAMDQVTQDNIHHTLIHLFKTSIKLMERNMYAYTIDLVIQYFLLLSYMKNQLSDNVQSLFDECVEKLVNLRLKYHGHTLLHILCVPKPPMEIKNHQFLFYSCPKAVQMLLEAGANPGSLDVQRNTPLHYIAKQQPLNYEIAKLLLQHGCHFDAVNCRGETFASLVGEQEVRKVTHPFHHVTLQCLSARVVANNAIPHSDLHPNMIQFIELHKTVTFIQGDSR